MTADEVRAARKALALNQKDFASLLGVNRAMTVSQWETGAKPVTETMSKLIQAYLDGWRPGVRVDAGIEEARRAGARQMLEAMTYEHQGERFVCFNENVDVLAQPGILAVLGSN